MHNGKFNELKDVLEFYEDISSGNSQNPLVANKDLDPLIKRIDSKVKDMGLIISFFNTLNNYDFDRGIPESVPSNLSVGGDIQ
jgi:cytochrome c peroxidase